MTFENRRAEGDPRCGRTAAEWRSSLNDPGPQYFVAGVRMQCGDPAWQRALERARE